MRLVLENQSGWCGVGLGQGGVRALWPQGLDKCMDWKKKKTLQRQDFPNSKCWDLRDLGFQRLLAMTKKEAINEKRGNANPTTLCLHVHNEKLLHWQR